MIDGPLKLFIVSLGISRRVDAGRQVAQRARRRARGLGARGEGARRPRELLVGGLPNDATVEEVKGYFEQYGEVDVDIKVDQETGRSRGFGFLAFQVRSGLK